MGDKRGYYNARRDQKNFMLLLVPMLIEYRRLLMGACCLRNEGEKPS